MSRDLTTSLQLLERARSGDTESLGVLLRTYFRYLNSLSRGHIDERIRMRVSASDVVQDTLLEAHRDFQSFVGTSIEEFTGWLRKILFNNLASAIEKHILAAKRDVRKQRSLNEKANEASESPSPFAKSLQDSISSPSTPMMRNESVQQITHAISQLPEDYRRVIQMRNYECLSFAQIADQLGRNSGATRMLWVRAVEALKIAMVKNDQ